MSLSYGFCLGEEGVQYSSEQFSAAFRAAFGDGICPYGGQFLVSASDTMNVSLATGVLYVYDFLTSGIDQVVAERMAEAEAILQKGEETIAAIEKATQAAGITKPIGEIEMVRTSPSPASEWLLCDGGTVPAAYPVLRELVGSTLPDIAPNDNRFSAWIYGGKPATEREEESVWMQ